MAWPVTDFDGVLFNDGSGAAEIVAIYNAIRERAMATHHSLFFAGDYSDEWPGGAVWLADPDGDSGKEYTKDFLQAFYDGIVSLLSGNPGIRWTEGSGNTTEWTISSLTTDIDGGDFADLLTKPANPYPFIWLHEALNRLIYAKVTLAPTGSLNQYTSVAGPHGTPQIAWDHRADGSSTPSVTSVGGIVLRWNVAFGYMAYVFRQYTGVTYATSLLAGVISEAYYKYNALWIEVSVGAFDVTIGTTSINTTGTVSSTLAASTDFTTGSDTIITADIDTTEPSTVPFNGFPSSGSGTVEVISTAAQLHIDLASVLTDQA